MNALSSMAATFRDHLTPSGRRASKPERQARKTRALQRRMQAKELVPHERVVFHGYHVP